MTKYLDEGKFYMNPCSGSVATAEEWEQDFLDTPESIKWQSWGGDNLIEVEKIDNEWIEVK